MLFINNLCTQHCLLKYSDVQSLCIYSIIIAHFCGQAPVFFQFPITSLFILYIEKQGIYRSQTFTEGLNGIHVLHQSNEVIFMICLLKHTVNSPYSKVGSTREQQPCPPLDSHLEHLHLVPTSLERAEAMSSWHQSLSQKGIGLYPQL